MIRIGMARYTYTWQAGEITCKGGKKRTHRLLSRESLAHRGIPVCSARYGENRPMGRSAMHKSGG
jgi:hypothetical protein